MKVLDFYETKTMAKMVMEKLNGLTVQEYIELKIPVTETVARLLMKQLATAVNYMHSMRVIHRDFNPRNVFLHFANGQPPEE